MSNSGTASIWAVGITGEKLSDKLTLKFQTLKLLKSNLEPERHGSQRKFSSSGPFSGSMFYVSSNCEICCFEITVENEGVSLMEPAIFSWMTCDRCWTDQNVISNFRCNQPFVPLVGNFVFFWHSSTSQHQILVKTLRKSPNRNWTKSLRKLFALWHWGSYGARDDIFSY